MVSVWGWFMQPETWHASVHEEVRVNVGNANASTGRLGTRGDVYFVDELMHIGSVSWLFLDPRLGKILFIGNSHQANSPPIPLVLRSVPWKLNEALKCLIPEVDEI
jgi:hypothetical protein